MVAQAVDDDINVRPFGPVGRSQDGQPVVDIAKDVAEESGTAVGTDALPDREDGADGSPANMLTVRGQDYPLPEIGPMAFLYGDRIEKQIRQAQDRKELLVKAGRPEGQAGEESGLNRALLEFLGFVADLTEGYVPRAVLMKLDMAEIIALKDQFRPFDATAPEQGRSRTSRNTTPATPNRTQRRAQSRSTSNSR